MNDRTFYTPNGRVDVELIDRHNATGHIVFDSHPQREDIATINSLIQTARDLSVVIQVAIPADAKSILTLCRRRFIDMGRVAGGKPGEVKHLFASDWPHV